MESTSAITAAPTSVPEPALTPNNTRGTKIRPDVINQDVKILSPFANGAPIEFKASELSLRGFRMFLELLSDTAPRIMESVTRLSSEDPHRDIHNVVADLNEKIEKRTKNNVRPTIRMPWNVPKATTRFAMKIVRLTIECSEPNYLAIREVKRTNEKADNYGEISFDQMAKILEELNSVKKLGGDDVFFDLGSGIAQFPLLVAAATSVCKVVGIEYLQKRHATAVTMKRFFERFMAYFGKKHGEVVLIQGDILDNSARISSEATVIFANNVSFRGLNSRIQSGILQNCRDQTRIVSTDRFSFGERDMKTRTRRGDVVAARSEVAMFREDRMTSLENGFSWTHQKVPLWLLTRDESQYDKLLQEAFRAAELAEARKAQMTMKKMERKRVRAQQKEQKCENQDAAANNQESESRGVKHDSPIAEKRHKPSD